MALQPAEKLSRSFIHLKEFYLYLSLFFLGEEEGRDEEAKARVCADTHIS